ncbi:hypothetical protein O181_051336 [Austropuccinia psidii MF-1]|uniref:Zn(2)-C6 fungal-type domain-containing protein n=1 Tax=Austropuccinia psidii MF-1 TaxID=1389203 RepID=A0A9Q3DW96_9BASI|nr:hypothetical protein [Austropuccinia psidii MF-1]
MATLNTIPPPKPPRPPQRPPACRACKRRKSKCDFEQPCSTCLLHNTVDTCQYDTMAVPRERRCPIRQSPNNSLLSRANDMKNLKHRLSEAEKLIVAQQKTIDSLHANARARNALGGDLGHPESLQSVNESQSKQEDRDYESGRATDVGKPGQLEGLADEMTRLVIGSAIAPLPTPSSVEIPQVQSPVALNGPSPERSTSGDVRQLRKNIINLLASHNNSSLEDFARTIGLAPSPQLTSTTNPIVATTILPEQETIKTVHELVALFPPSKSEAISLLETYLSFVNLLHHVVDGPQTRYEIELFYDVLLLHSYSLDKPSPMPLPHLLEPGWLSAMLAIFVLADRSESGGLLRSPSANDRCNLWLEGSLQGLRMRFKGDSVLDLSALRSVCLVVWIYVLYGQDNETLPAINLNSVALYRACDKLQLHRDPSRLDPALSPRQAEDRRRVFYNLINTDWLFSAIAGKTYSPVGVDGHDVGLPRAIGDRDPNSLAISGLAFRSLLMRQLRKLATLALKPRGISQADAVKFENELDALDERLPQWCKIDVDDFPASRCSGDPQGQAEFSQQIITNVQLCAVRVRFHTKFASPGSDVPIWMREGASHHRTICISRAVRLLRLEQLHLKYATRVLGHSGYPRFHPIVGGLTLSALMARSSDPLERRTLFEELSRFTAGIQSYGALSQVTNYGILAIETALAEVRRGMLSEQGLTNNVCETSFKQEDETRRSSAYYSSVCPSMVAYDGAPTLTSMTPTSELDLTPLTRPQNNPHHYRPPPIILPMPIHSTASTLKSPTKPCPIASDNLYELHSGRGLGTLVESEPFLLSSTTISPTMANSPQCSQSSTGNEGSMDASIQNIFTNFQGGVSYEGLMFGWMGAGLDNNPRSTPNAPGMAGQSCELMIPPIQNSWKQEW